MMRPEWFVDIWSVGRAFEGSRVGWMSAARALIGARLLL